MSRRLRIVLIAVVVVVLAASAALPALRGIAEADVSVPVYEVERGDFVRRVRADGNLCFERCSTVSNICLFAAAPRLKPV